MSDQNIETLRHSIAHILAAAVKELYPNAKLGIGPNIDNGFYYDFDFGEPLHPDEMKKIEKKMQEIINKKLDFTSEQKTIAEAREIFKDEPYKIELIDELEKEGEEKVSLYHTGDFTDLCRGPHISNTSEIQKGSWKLDTLAGAYWRGSEKNPMLTRIYGLAFATNEDLKAYQKLLQEAEKRDHRKLGKKLDLFSFHEEGPGFPFWHGRGTILYNVLTDWIRTENSARGYHEVRTPPLLSSELWKKSGHWDHFRDNMYFTDIDEGDYAVKPMNCPGGCLIFAEKSPSYRELPIRAAEFGLVHRHELSGVLHGLFRVRSFTQDDAHSFCTVDQLPNEIEQMIEYAEDVYSTFGFKKVNTFIATRPEDSMGEDEVWERATDALKNSLDKRGLEYGIKEGEGAFYGPKIEFNVEDAIGRNWQLGTIQIDFSMPVRFDLNYIDENGEKVHPVMVHRAILGSLERMIGILIEHYSGDFPLWMAPTQVRVLPVSEKFNDYAKEVLKKLNDAGLRAEIDMSDESLGKKVRNAEVMKIPRILVVGEKEKSDSTVAVRILHSQDQEIMSVDDFIKKAKETIENKE